MSISVAPLGSFGSKLSLNAAELPKLDAEFEEIIPQSRDEEEFRQKMLAKWAALEALVGDPKRIALVAADLVAHFEKRLEAMDDRLRRTLPTNDVCRQAHAGHRPREPVLTPSLPPLGRASPNAAHCLSRTLRRARLRDKPGGLVVDSCCMASTTSKTKAS